MTVTGDFDAYAVARRNGRPIHLKFISASGLSWGPCFGPEAEHEELPEVITVSVFGVPGHYFAEWPDCPTVRAWGSTLEELSESLKCARWGARRP